MEGELVFLGVSARASAVILRTGNETFLGVYATLGGVFKGTVPGDRAAAVRRRIERDLPADWSWVTP